MARTWLIDSRGLAKKVKNAGLPAAYQIKDCGANKECPNCHYHIDNTDNAKNLKDPSDPPSGFWFEDEAEYATCLAGESQAADFVGVDSLFCNEIIDSNTIFGDPRPHNSSLAQEGGDIKDVTASGGISDLDNIELDTPLDFNLSDLQFASQDSVFDWLNQL